jgi:hypothetical protein
MEPIRELKYWCKTGEPSKLGIRVAAMLADWAGGGHHLEMAAMEKVDWTNEAYIRCQLDTGYIDGDLSTFDFDGLTRLVFLAHDYSIRVAVSPINRRSLQFLFHGRNRTGGFSQRHPTIEQAVNLWRKRHKEIIHD